MAYEVATIKNKKDRARTWIHSYTAVGTGIVVAAAFPGSTSAVLAGIEAHMCWEIGKIYRGENYSLSDAVLAAGSIGIAGVAGPMIALEALNFLPGPGWIAKGLTAGGIIKTLGELVIVHYEQLERGR